MRYFCLRVVGGGQDEARLKTQTSSAHPTPQIQPHVCLSCWGCALQEGPPRTSAAMQPFFLCINFSHTNWLSTATNLLLTLTAHTAWFWIWCATLEREPYVGCVCYTGMTTHWKSSQKCLDQKKSLFNSQNRNPTIEISSGQMYFGLCFRQVLQW